jgi:hypothetical protein
MDFLGLSGTAAWLLDQVGHLIGDDNAVDPIHPDTALALARGWGDVATALSEGIVAAEGAAKVIFAQWPDEAGHSYYRMIQSFHGSLTGLITACREMQTFCENTAKELAIQRLATRIEVIITAVSVVMALAGGSGAIVGLIARRLASSVLKRMLTAAARVALRAQGRSAFQHAAVEIGLGTLEESVISYGSQAWAQAQGYNPDGVDTTRLMKDTVAGAIGEAAAYGPGKLISNKIKPKGMLGQHAVAAATGGGLTALTSPGAGLLASDLVDFAKTGEFHGATLADYGKSYAENAETAARMGAARSNGTLAGSQVNAVARAHFGSPEAQVGANPSGPEGPPPDPTPATATASATASATEGGSAVTGGEATGGATGTANESANAGGTTTGDGSAGGTVTGDGSAGGSMSGKGMATGTPGQAGAPDGSTGARAAPPAGEPTMEGSTLGEATAGPSPDGQTASAPGGETVNGNTAAEGHVTGSEAVTGGEATGSTAVSGEQSASHSSETTLTGGEAQAGNENTTHSGAQSTVEGQVAAVLGPGGTTHQTTTPVTPGRSGTGARIGESTSDPSCAPAAPAEQAPAGPVEISGEVWGGLSRPVQDAITGLFGDPSTPQSVKNEVAALAGLTLSDQAKLAIIEVAADPRLRSLAQLVDIARMAPDTPALEAAIGFAKQLRHASNQRIRELHNLVRTKSPALGPLLAELGLTAPQQNAAPEPAAARTPVRAHVSEIVRRLPQRW